MRGEGCISSFFDTQVGLYSRGCSSDFISPPLSHFIVVRSDIHPGWSERIYGIFSEEEVAFTPHPSLLTPHDFKWQN